MIEVVMSILSINIFYFLFVIFLALVLAVYFDDEDSHTKSKKSNDLYDYYFTDSCSKDDTNDNCSDD